METLELDVAGIVAEVAEVPRDAVTLETRLDELGIDSLDALRIVAGVEKLLRREIPEESISQVETVGDVVRMATAAG